ncbi:hypothetical protein TNCT_396711 [Trichonephila clavata]|uniref:Uncharacterized protein n=1 Tax=Trichonephila clavata TaxID=2740835 RepID=A0A8X6LFQ0_TRICU|nr:hypothetical protein TNCT_396711 [Trichonephila clavata]
MLLVSEKSTKAQLIGPIITIMTHLRKDVVLKCGHSNSYYKSPCVKSPSSQRVTTIFREICLLKASVNSSLTCIVVVCYGYPLLPIRQYTYLLRGVILVTRPRTRRLLHVQVF